MKIAKYIGDLLFEYECIVIPDFGGFITKEVSAKILPIQNHFIPPSKKIVFNVHLKTNDGLLVNYIARKANLTYDEARYDVESCAKKCMIELNNGKQIRFRKVGIIFMDKENNILFEPDKTQNYLSDSFGLKSFISPTIKRTTTHSAFVRSKKSTTTARSPKETIKKEKQRKAPKIITKGPRYINVNVSFVVIFIAISFLFVFKFNTVKTYYNEYAGFIPFFNSTPDDYIAKNIDKKPVLGVITLLDKLKPKDKNSPKVKKQINEPGKQSQKPKREEEINQQEDIDQHQIKETTIPEKGVVDDKKAEQESKEVSEETSVSKIEIKKEDAFKYFIIAGSFKDKVNAEKLIKKLKAKGFKSTIINKNKHGNYRVCFEAFINIKKANQQLAIIRKEENSSAWLLSI
jgi:hypothetical protein